MVRRLIRACGLVRDPECTESDRKLQVLKDAQRFVFGVLWKEVSTAEIIAISYYFLTVFNNASCYDKSLKKLPKSHSGKARCRLDVLF
jgi:hypothetical protein